MSYFPDEAHLIERMWGLICNSSDLKSGLRWDGDTPVATGPSQSPDSVEWRAIMSNVREEYHNWLGFYIATHHPDTHASDTEPSLGDLIESLKMLCDCGHCDGAWVSRFEAHHIIAKLKRLAELETAE